MAKGWRKKQRVVKRKLADGTVKEYRYGAYTKNNRVVEDSVEALIRAYERSPAWQALALNTQSGYRQYIRHLAAPMGAVAARAVTRREIIGLRDVIARQSGPGAATGFIRAVGSLFAWGVRNDWVERSPIYEIKRLHSGHLPAWTAEQAAIALSGLPERFRRVVVLGLYTGQRRGDLCAVRWSAYTGSEIRFTQAKTGTTLVLAVHPELKKELDSWERTAVTILTDARGRPWSANKLSVTLPPALCALGLPRGLNVHGLRKLFATAVADGGGTSSQIAAGTGHRTLGMVDLYTKTRDQRRLGAEAVLLLPTFGQSVSPTTEKHLEKPQKSAT